MRFATRPLDPSTDWQFFDPTDSLGDEDRRWICPLTEESADQLWRQFVSSESAQRHPMLISGDHWLGDTITIGPDWSESWRADMEDDALRHFLNASIAWPPDIAVYFIAMRERIIQCPWRVFLRTWRCFLFENEGPFLISLAEPEFVAFPPVGHVRVGKRPL